MSCCDVTVILPCAHAHWSILCGIKCTWKKQNSFHRHWPAVVLFGQEALSVVSEDQPIFEPTYNTAPAMHMKTEMTSPGAFSQASKPSPEPTEPEWVGSVAQNPGKRAEQHVNGTRWVRTDRGHRGAQVPGLSDCRFVTIQLWDFPDPKNVYCSFTVFFFVVFPPLIVKMFEYHMC